MPTFSDQDSAVIMSLWEQYGQAFAAQDADSIAALFAPDGDLIGVEGRLVSGPEAIAEEYRNEFSRSFEGLSLRDVELHSPRPLNPHVGLMNGGWIVDGLASGPFQVRSTFVVRRDTEGWRYVAVRFAAARDLE